MNGHVLVSLAALAAISGWLRRWPMLRGTTLQAPWFWTLAAFLALLAVELTHDDNAGIKYLATAATFCPLVSVLGAKRPQDRAWQFIVAALWLVLALPGVQQWLGRRPTVLQLHAAWQWFLAVLIALGFFNGLPTRLWLSSLLAGIGQTAMLINQLPLPSLGLSVEQTTQAWTIGFMTWCVSVALWGWDLPRRRRETSPYDRLWLDFRDLVGGVWALRIAERINAAASTCGWESRLTWSGWVIHGDETTLEPDVERSLRMLLRRFVSQEWIDHRLATSTTLAQPNS